MHLKLERKVMQGHYMGPLCPKEAKHDPERVERAMEDALSEAPKALLGVEARPAGIEVAGELVEALFVTCASRLPRS